MNIEYLQKSNESFFNYKERLCVGKIDRTIDLDWEEINDLLGLETTPDYLRKMAQGIYEAYNYRMRENSEAQSDTEIDESYKRKQIFTKNKDGSYTREKIIELEPCDVLDDRTLLIKHDFVPPEFWTVVSSQHKIYQVNRKGGNTVDLYSSQITVKPKKNQFTPEDVEKFIEEKLKNYKSPIHKPTNYSKDGMTLTVNFMDLHYGKLSWHGDSSEDYDLDIADERFNFTMNDIATRIGKTKLKKIYLVNGGDGLHFDNLAGTTSAGTALDTDSRMPKVFNIALDAFIRAIDLFSQFAPVEVPFIMGNHDSFSGWCLVKCLACWYRNNEGVVIDDSPLPRKFRRIGVTLLGWEHGDGVKNKLGNWLKVEAKEEFGQTKYAEVHVGHIHTQQMIENDGVIIRYLPSIASPDSWHYKNGYIGNVKATCSFLWDDEKGLQEVWYTNII